MRNPISTAAISVVDLAHVALAALWPRSAVRQEIERLRDEGHQDGDETEMAFSICFAEPAHFGELMPAVRALGYVPEGSSSERGFVTVRRTLRLQAYELAQAVRGLERAVASRSAFVAVIGPTRPAAYPVPDRASTRMSAREYEERMAAA